MANLFWQNCGIRVGGTNLSGYLNQVSLKVTAVALDATTFTNSYQVRLGGLKEITMEEGGFWDSTPDAVEFAGLGVADQAVTIIPTGAETETAYLFQAGNFTYEQFGQVGDVVPFSASLFGTNAAGAVRGQAAAINRSVSGTGQLGSVLTMAGPSATQYVYATLHVQTAATTITVQVQSAPTFAFAAPTTRATIGPITTVGGTFMTRVIGPFTDGFWRFNVSAITGTFLVTGAVGVQ